MANKNMNAKITLPNTFTPASERTNISAEDNIITAMSKSAKYFNDLGTAAYTASTAYAVNSTLTNQNLNNVTTPGFYNASGGNSVTNKPSGIDAFGLEVVHTASGSYYSQKIYSNSGIYVYKRYCSNGTWRAWILQQGDMSSYSEPSSTSAITTSDSITTAIGKLEKGLDDVNTTIGTINSTLEEVL